MASFSTWAAATVRCRELGYSVRATGLGAERAVYPKGTARPLDAATTYFTDDPEDAVGTVRAMADRATSR